MSAASTVIVDVIPGAGELDVRCQAKAGSSKLQIDRVTFHALTDKQYRTIVTAIELYLSRKNLRERQAQASAAAAEAPNAEV